MKTKPKGNQEWVSTTYNTLNEIEGEQGENFFIKMNKGLKRFERKCQIPKLCKEDLTYG